MVSIYNLLLSGRFMLMTHFIAWMLLGSGMILGSGMVFGQEYPTKPIRIVTSAAGGGSDFVARQTVQGISGPFGQSVIVENRGSPILAEETATKAAPDGYTLLVAGGATWVRPLLSKMAWDPVKDLAPISWIERSP